MMFERICSTYFIVATINFLYLSFGPLYHSDFLTVIIWGFFSSVLWPFYWILVFLGVEEPTFVLYISYAIIVSFAILIKVLIDKFRK